MCVLERTPRSITVRLSNGRWNRLMELEIADQTAQAVARAKREYQTAPSMSVSDALKFIDSF